MNNYFRWDKETKGTPKSMADDLIKSQVKVNKFWSEYTDVLAIPLGANLIKEIQRIKGKWWYKFFTFVENQV